MVAAYLSVIAIAEASIAFWNPLVGVALDGALLVVMVTHSAIRYQDVGPAVDSEGLDFARAIAALSFVPIIRLVSVSAPLGGTSQVSQLFVVEGILLAAIAWARWRARLPTSPRLRPRSLTNDLFVVCLGLPLLVGAHFALRPASVAEGTRSSQLGAAALAVALVAVVEELVFRGFIQTAFYRLRGPSAPLWATALYVVSSLGVRPLRLLALAAVLGLVFGWIVQRNGSLVGVTVSHALINIGLFVLLAHVQASSS